MSCFTYHHLIRPAWRNRQWTGIRKKKWTFWILRIQKIMVSINFPSTDPAKITSRVGAVSWRTYHIPPYTLKIFKIPAPAIFM